MNEQLKAFGVRLNRALYEAIRKPELRRRRTVVGQLLDSLDVRRGLGCDGIERRENRKLSQGLLQES